jgi:phosphodiesterase/alkaline phosphatase D-like protein
MPVPAISFSHGVASGDPYQDSVILWTRITPPQEYTGLVDVRWEVSTSAGFEPGSITGSGVFSTSGERDWTVKVEADGLTADTTYHYRFSVGEVDSQVGQTKTLPVGNDPVRLAVFSCANFTAAEEFLVYGRAAALHAANPYDALLHLGDYIYEYGPGGFAEAEDAADDRGFLPNREIVSLDDYRQRYAQYHTDLNLQALRASAPLIAIWDDHETANDSWTGGAQNHQSATEGDWLARRDAALKAYHEWLPIREPALRRPEDGATALTPLTQGYRSFDFGEVLSLHLLETRLSARDEPLAYPDAAAVQARIGAILADPALVLAYAGQLGLTPPAGPAAIPAFAAALAPVVTQELVLATVQQAWGDPSRDLIGDTQLAWLQQQMAASTASWQVLGQQVLMQSMAIPAALLLDPGNPALLDTYGAPLQKLATGTPFAQLTPEEQALFAEQAKIPYNLDAWDGYGVERETILQMALGLGKKLVSLAGDTHNAWAGVLDTMSAGTQPAGTVAGVEFAAPGVTSPGFEKYLPGADAYIRARYPDVGGLDGLFLGYTKGLGYADVNRRGFLELTVTPTEASGTFQFLDRLDPLAVAPQWASETVVAASDLTLTLGAEARSLIDWQPEWQELDLVTGLVVEVDGSQTLLDPAAFATAPRNGIQLADVQVRGSAGSDRFFVGVGSSADGGAGDDDLFNSESLGGNWLVGGTGADRFFLRQAKDLVVGGSLISGSRGLAPGSAVVDGQADQFLIDSSEADASADLLQINDFEVNRDVALIDGVLAQGSWAEIKQALAAAGVAANAAPQLLAAVAPPRLTLFPGIQGLQTFGTLGTDLDNDALQVVVLEGPDWLTSFNNTLSATAPAGLTQADLAGLSIRLGLYDGKAVTPFVPELALGSAPAGDADTSFIAITQPDGSVRFFAVEVDGGTFQAPVRVVATEQEVSTSAAGYQQAVITQQFELSERALDFAIDLNPGVSQARVTVELAAVLDPQQLSDESGRDPSKRLGYFAVEDSGNLAPLTYDPVQGSGARFYDRDGDGSVDFLNLTLTDGGIGDKDGAVNGVIVDPSVAAVVELNPVLSAAGNTLTVSDPAKATAPASLALRASLGNRAATANQIGYVVLNSTEVASADTLLADLNTVQARAQTLFSNLESTDVTLPSGATFEREILLLNGQSVRFFEVVDGTVDQLTSLNDPRFRFLTPAGVTDTQASVASTSGVSFSLTVPTTDQGLADLIGQEQGAAPVLDFSSFSPSETVSGSLLLAREANFDSIIGFYRSLDAQGAVLAADGSTVLRPGDLGYAAEALRADNLVGELSNLQVADNQTITTPISVSESSFLAPFARVNGDTFFAYGAANSDGLSHFRTLGSNTFGLEDLKGGGDLDFDDLVLGFSFTSLSTTPLLT